MVQEWRALPALLGHKLKGQHHMAANNSVNCSLRGYNSLLCLPWAPGMHMDHRLTYREIIIHLK